MNPIDATVLKVIKNAVFPYEKPEELQTDVDYEAVFRELRDQAVISLTADIIETIPIGGELLRNWQKAVYQYLYKGVVLSEEENRILRILDGIDVCVMKGSAAAIYYPNPEIRTFGDIDLLVRPGDYRHSIEKLIADGYQIDDPGRPSNRNVQLYKGMVEIELHQSYFGGRFMQGNDERDERLFEAMSTCQHRQIFHHVFPMFDDANNGMILLHHFHRHILDGVGIRHLIDWMMFVSTVCDDEYWDKTFRTIVERLDLLTFAKTITRMCQLYLGLQQTITWCHGVDESYCEIFMTYLLEKGNFGKKSQFTEEEIVLNKLSTRKSFRQEWKHLQCKGLENWPLAKRIPFLSAFAWIYQLGVYINKGIRMNAVKHMVNQQHKAAERNKMFRLFHVIK